MNHQLNRLTGGTDITQPNHLLVINPMPPKRYKYNHQITNKNILSAITAKRAFDKYPMPSKRYNHIKLTITAKRAFRGMAGLAVLYPSVLDYIGQAVKDSPVCLLGDFRGYSVLLPSAHSSMICPADNFFCSEICLI